MKTISTLRCEDAGELVAAIQNAIADSKQHASCVYPYTATGSEYWEVKLLEDTLTDGSLVYHIEIREEVVG